MRALRYAFEEAFSSLWRGRQAGLLSTLTIALALFVLGRRWFMSRFKPVLNLPHTGVH